MKFMVKYLLCRQLRLVQKAGKSPKTLPNHKEPPTHRFHDYFYVSGPLAWWLSGSRIEDSEDWGILF